MADDMPKRFFTDIPEKTDKGKETDIAADEFPSQSSEIKDYSRKKTDIDNAAIYTKESVLAKCGDVIGEAQKERISQEIVPERYEIYNQKFFLETKLAGVPLEQRQNILGYHEVEEHNIALRDSDNSDELKHVATHETMHSLSYQEHLYQQNVDKWSEIETLDYLGEKDRSGIREITYLNVESISGSAERVRVSDTNSGLNEGLTELYTLREIQNRGDEPGLAAYTQQVNWARKLEACVGENTVIEAYFGGRLENLKNSVNELGEDPHTWDQLSAAIDRYGRLGGAEYLERQMYERKINEMLQKLWHNSPQRLESCAASKGE